MSKNLGESGIRQSSGAFVLKENLYRDRSQLLGTKRKSQEGVKPKNNRREGISGVNNSVFLLPQRLVKE